MIQNSKHGKENSIHILLYCALTEMRNAKINKCHWMKPHINVGSHYDKKWTSQMFTRIMVLLYTVITYKYLNKINFARLLCPAEKYCHFYNDVKLQTESQGTYVLECRVYVIRNVFCMENIDIPILIIQLSTDPKWAIA